MKVLCIGHATYDIVITVDSYPKENTKNKAVSDVRCGGGPSANASYLLAKWGIDTYFAGVVGDDYAGNYVEAEFKNIGVKLDYFTKSKDIKTTNSYIIVNTINGSRTIFSSQDEKIDIKNTNIEIKPDIILIDGYEAELSKRVINDNKDAIVVIDAGKCNKDIIDLCRLSDYIVCSLDFAKEYTGYSDVNKMLEKLNNDFSGNIIITLEDKGCAYYENGPKIINSIPTKPVDTTGAGDIFHGAFVYGLIKKWDMYKILTFACTTSGLSITKLSGRKSIFPLEQVKRVYDELRKCNFY